MSEAIELQQLNKHNVKDVVKLFEICFHASCSTKDFLHKYNFEDTKFTNLAYLVYYNSEIAGFFGVIYEEMISNEESRNCIEVDEKYIISTNGFSEYLKKKNKFTTKAFNKKSFRSNDNKFLKPKELLQTINKEYQNYIF